MKKQRTLLALLNSAITNRWRIRSPKNTGKLDEDLSLRKRSLITLLCLVVCAQVTPAVSLVFAVAGFEENTDSFRVAQSIASDVAHRCGTEIVLASIPYQRQNYLLRSQEIDGSFSQKNRFDEGAPGLIRVEEPIAEFFLYAYSKIKDLKIDGWESLKDYKVAYNSGSAITREKLTSKEENTTAFSSDRAALQFLDSGRAEIFVGLPFAIEPLLKGDRFKTKGIAALLPPLDVYYTYIHIQPKHAQLAKCFNSELKKTNEVKAYEQTLRGGL